MFQVLLFISILIEGVVYCWKKGDLDWVKGRFEEKYEIKHQRIGPGPRDNKVVRILNRVVQWDDSGIKYEADQRHAEIIVKRLGLTNTKKGCKHTRR